MKTFEASITIATPPETVWGILTDAPSYPEWDPYCERIEGRIAPGETLRAYTTLSPGRAFPVRVSTFEPPRKMTWTGGLPLGLFKGVRSFTLAESEEGTAFTVREVFSGPLLPLFGRSLPDMTEPFQAFATGLKQRAEGQTVSE